MRVGPISSHGPSRGRQPSLADVTEVRQKKKKQRLHAWQRLDPPLLEGPRGKHGTEGRWPPRSKTGPRQRPARKTLQSCAPRNWTGPPTRASLQENIPQPLRRGHHGGLLDRGRGDTEQGTQLSHPQGALQTSDRRPLWDKNWLVFETMTLGPFVSHAAHRSWGDTDDTQTHKIQHRPEFHVERRTLNGQVSEWHGHPNARCALHPNDKERAGDGFGGEPAAARLGFV